MKKLENIEYKSKVYSWSIDDLLIINLLKNDKVQELRVKVRLGLFSHIHQWNKITSKNNLVVLIVLRNFEILLFDLFHVEEVASFLLNLLSMYL